MEQNENTKVYTFDLSQFKKNTLKKLIAYSISIVIFLSIMLFAYITTFDSLFLIVLSSSLYIMLLYFTVVKEFIAYSRADKIHKDDSVTVYKKNEHIVSVNIKMQGTKFNENYSIKRITDLHRKNYIDVEGVIHCLYNESSDDATDLRIPPYFEDMDEIYSELERLKDQPCTL